MLLSIALLSKPPDRSFHNFRASNQAIDDLDLAKKRLSTYFEALKLQNGRSRRKTRYEKQKYNH